VNGLNYLARALDDCGRIELRHEDGGRWASGTFNSLDALQQEIEARRDRGNLYTSINAPADGGAANAMGGEAWRDSDIRFVVRLFVDFDPVRPRGGASTVGELDAAIDRRNLFMAAQSTIGWPDPAVGISGNGAHALYRCRIRATPDLADQLAKLYRRWRDEWSDGLVEFDPTVRNPARICRLYGTINRKGQATADRPHRVSSLVIPSMWSEISPDLIAMAAAAYRPALPQGLPRHETLAPIGRGNYATLDVVAWFVAHGLYKRRKSPGMHAVHCPWTSEHSTYSSRHETDTVIFDAKPPKLWPRFYCHHAHCAARKITDLIALWGDADAFCAATLWQERR
jgi:hypothetical protein